MNFKVVLLHSTMSSYDTRFFTKSYRYIESKSYNGAFIFVSL